jgi:hypothetical protein
LCELICVTAAEEVIDHLRTENDKLLGQINDLGNELTSVRYVIFYILPPFLLFCKFLWILIEKKGFCKIYTNNIDLGIMIQFWPGGV